MKYGLPYKGSKNLIAEKIVGQFPSAENFYDLFAGGCAITHCALLSGKFKHIYFNDIDGSITQLFLDAINGKYKNEKRWISREDFHNLKEKDAYIKYCWSFSNAGEHYLYSKEIEMWKKATHYARVFDDYSLLNEMEIYFSDYEKQNIRIAITKRQDECKEKYIKWYLKNVIKSDVDFEKEKQNLNKKIKNNSEELRQYLLNALKKSGLTQRDVDRRTGTQMSGHYFGKSQWLFPTEEEYKKLQEFLPLDKDYWEVFKLQDSFQRLQRLQRLQSLGNLQSLERLQRLQRLQSLESLQSFQSLQSLNCSYDEVEIKKNSVIYCDIPYKNTDDYGMDFDYEKFYKWAESQTELTFISEYNMPEEI